MLQYAFMNKSETIYTTMVTVIVSSHSLCSSDFSISVYYSDRTIVQFLKDKTLRRTKKLFILIHFQPVWNSDCLQIIHFACPSDFSRSAYYFHRKKKKRDKFQRIKHFEGLKKFPPNSCSASLKLCFSECFYIYKQVERNTLYLPFIIFPTEKT